MNQKHIEEESISFLAHQKEELFMMRIQKNGGRRFVAVLATPELLKDGSRNVPERDPRGKERRIKIVKHLTGKEAVVMFSGGATDTVVWGNAYFLMNEERDILENK